ncbi:MAG: hypothetical protein Q9166_004724 [cf. Caloplaca sp. 2 TL-2023]
MGDRACTLLRSLGVVTHEETPALWVMRGSRPLEGRRDKEEWGFQEEGDLCREELRSRRAGATGRRWFSSYNAHVRAPNATARGGANVGAGVGARAGAGAAAGMGGGRM